MLPLIRGCLRAKGRYACAINDRLLFICILPLKGKSIRAEPMREQLGAHLLPKSLCIIQETSEFVLSSGLIVWTHFGNRE